MLQNEMDEIHKETARRLQHEIEDLADHYQEDGYCLTINGMKITGGNICVEVTQKPG